MSSTPLIEIENAVYNVVRRDEFTVWQAFKTVFQGWEARADLEWNAKTGKLKNYTMSIQNPLLPKGRLMGDIRSERNLKGKDWLSSPATSFSMAFTGTGAMGVQDASVHMNTLQVTLEHAKALDRRLQVGGQFPMPVVEEFEEPVWLLGSREDMDK